MYFNLRIGRYYHVSHNLKSIEYLLYAPIICTIKCFQNGKCVIRFYSDMTELKAIDLAPGGKVWN